MAGGDNHDTRVLDLLNEIGPQLHGLLTRLTLREDVAEDLLQELFLRLHRCSGFGQAASGRAYARRVAIHLAFDWRRRQKRHRLTSLPDDDLADARGSPLQDLIDREALEQVLEALARLNASRRDVFVLRYIERLSVEQVSEMVGKSAHHVRSLCHKAIIQLRGLVTAHNRTTNRQGA